MGEFEKRNGKTRNTKYASRNNVKASECLYNVVRDKLMQRAGAKRAGPQAASLGKAEHSKPEHFALCSERNCKRKNAEACIMKRRPKGTLALLQRPSCVQIDRKRQALDKKHVGKNQRRA